MARLVADEFSGPMVGGVDIADWVLQSWLEKRRIPVE
jgi:hypothetical protein